jgi:hypothetical protein
MRKMTDPISEWTLKECINALKRMDADLLEYGYAIYIADRIHELTRWIPVSERMPTKDDALNGQVLVKEENWTTDHAYSIAYYKNIEPDVPERQPSEWYVTYWQRITPPEDKP